MFIAGVDTEALTGGLVQGNNCRGGHRIYYISEITNWVREGRETGENKKRGGCPLPGKI